jgi:hypothetical protein
MRDNFKIKKVEISMKNPETDQNMKFSSINPKITIFLKKSSILVILSLAEHLFLHSGQFRDKKSLDLHEKSLDLSKNNDKNPLNS